MNLPPTSATIPEAAATTTRLIQAASTTCLAAVAGSAPRRVNGAAEISESENAVAVTNIAARR
jgi:hypothetical protein